MPKPLKVRRANEFVGLFVLLALTIAVIALVLGPTTQRWFTPSRSIAIHLPPEGSLGLRKGGDVQILGSVVGSVEDIIVTDAGNMEAEVTIHGNFIRFVRKDSRAIIRKPFGLGDASIEITRGKGDPLPVRGAAIDSVADKAPTQMMEETLAAVRDEALPAITELRMAVVEYTQLAAELRAERANLQQALMHLNRVGEALEKREGVAGMLLFDPKPAQELRAALPKINASLDELHATLVGTRKFATLLPQIGADMQVSMKNMRASSVEAHRFATTMPALETSIKHAVDTVPGVLMQTQQTMYQVQRLTEGMQRSWLVRGHMDKAQTDTRLSGDRVGSDR